MVKLDNRQLNWYGHIASRNPGRITKKVMKTRKGKKIKRGRPRKDWMERVEEVGVSRKVVVDSKCEELGMGLNEMRWKR